MSERELSILECCLFMDEALTNRAFKLNVSETNLVFVSADGERGWDISHCPFCGKEIKIINSEVANG